MTKRLTSSSFEAGPGVLPVLANDPGPAASLILFELPASVTLEAPASDVLFLPLASACDSDPELATDVCSGEPMSEGGVSKCAADANVVPAAVRRALIEVGGSGDCPREGARGGEGTRKAA